MPEEAAIGWAMMVRAVLNDNTLANPSGAVISLYPKGPNSGYRTFNEQYKFHVDYYIAMRYEVAQGKCGSSMLETLKKARDKKVNELYGDKVTFKQLTEAQKDSVCQSIISDYASYPGKSKHGFGGAIDFNTNSKDVLYKWLNKNSENYGFKPYYKEEWHWNYRPDLGLNVGLCIKRKTVICNSKYRINIVGIYIVFQHLTGRPDKGVLISLIVENIRKQ